MGKDSNIPQWMTNLNYMLKNFGLAVVGCIWFAWFSQTLITKLVEQQQMLVKVIELMRAEEQRDHQAIKEELDKLVVRSPQANGGYGTR